MLAVRAGNHLLHRSTLEGIRDPGFPDFFRIELEVLMFMTIVILLLLQIPIQMKEWAYAGVAF